VLFAAMPPDVVDPMTGEGIAQALETGTLAAARDRLRRAPGTSRRGTGRVRDRRVWAPTCASPRGCQRC
jgi:hypothetical protein